MDKTIIINGNNYRIEKNGNQIHMQRYNADFKMWVNLYFPTDKKYNQNSFVEILSDLYIQRHLKTAENE